MTKIPVFDSRRRVFSAAGAETDFNSDRGEHGILLPVADVNGGTLTQESISSVSGIFLSALLSAEMIWTQDRLGSRSTARSRINFSNSFLVNMIQGNLIRMNRNTLRLVKLCA